MRWLIPAAVLLVILVIGSLCVVVFSIWPIQSVSPTQTANPSPAGSSTTVVEREEVLKEKLEAYSKRADDLQKLISVLLGLSTIYAIVLAVGAYTSTQSNLQQAEKSIAKLETLLLEVPKRFTEFQDKSVYSSRIVFASGSLALALQNQYLGDAERAIQGLLDLRDGSYSTDSHVNLLLGRLYKALSRFQAAEQAMSSFIVKKRKADKGDDAITADAYYNRACYQSLRWAGAKANERTKLRNGIERDLRRIFKLDESYRASAQRDDDDFKAVRKEDWFKNLFD
jgi:hypothetical protein